jgi:transposase
VARSKNGEAISPDRRRGKDLKEVRSLLEDADARGDLMEWRRARAVIGYIDGKTVIEMAGELGVVRSAINRWLGWYEAEGANGLRTRKSPGAAPKLDERQRAALADLIEGGPRALGYSSGIWTGPMIGDLIAERFGVRYHNHYIPRLLHDLGFSVQRPRRRWARADAKAQATWLRERLPAIKKKQRRVAA